MAYDSESAAAVLFGGQSPDGTYFDQTLAFENGVRWKQMAPATVPPGRSYPAMTYDSKVDRVLLWGGAADDSMWEYDYSSDAWSEVKTTGGPSRRANLHMVYLPNQDKTLLFGGRDIATGELLGDTWLYDNAAKTWQKLDLSLAPSPREHYAMCHNSDNGLVYLYGGGINDMWSFDPANLSWTKLLVPTP